MSVRSKENVFSKVLKVYRVKSWIKNLGIPLLAFLLNKENNISMLLSVLAHESLLFAHAFSINDFFDFKLMNENNYISNQIKKGESEVKYLILTILPLLPALVFTLFLPTSVLIFSFLFVLFFDSYSCPPTRLKRHWFPSFLINPVAISTLPFLTVYFLFSNTLTTQALLFLIIFFAYILSSEILHQIAHRKKDKKGKIQSFPNIYGIKNSLKLFQAIQVFLALISVYFLFTDFFSHSFLLLTIFFSLLRIVKIRNINIRRTNFEKIRNEIYGMQEGICYLVWLLIFNLA